MTATSNVPFKNDGLNVFAPSLYGEDDAMVPFIDVSASRVAALADPTWNLEGYEIPLPPGSYRVTARAWSDDEYGVKRVATLTIQNVEALDADVEEEELAGLLVDSGYAGLYVGGMWFISRSGEGDGHYPFYQLKDRSTDRVVGVRADFTKTSEYEDAIPKMVVKAPAPDPFSLRDPCLDCALDLNKNGQGHYILRPDIPGGSWSGRTPYCVPCVERRVGRELVPEDFVDVAINYWATTSSILAQRRGDALPYEVRKRRFFDRKAEGVLDPRVPSDLAEALYEVLRFRPYARITRTNREFTLTVAELLKNAEASAPGEDPVTVLRGILADIEQNGPSDKFQCHFADLHFAAWERLEQQTATQGKPRMTVSGF